MSTLFHLTTSESTRNKEVYQRRGHRSRVMQVLVQLAARIPALWHTLILIFKQKRDCSQSISIWSYSRQHINHLRGLNSNFNIIIDQIIETTKNNSMLSVLASALCLYKEKTATGLLFFSFFSSFISKGLILLYLAEDWPLLMTTSLQQPPFSFRRKKIHTLTLV